MPSWKYLEGFWYPVENSGKSSGVRGHVCSLKGCRWQLFFYQHLTGESWPSRLPPQGIWQNVRTPRPAWLHCHSLQALVQTATSFQTLPFHSGFFFLNKVTGHHKENIQSIVWERGSTKWDCLVCNVWIINKYSHLCWASGWWRTQPTIWNKHIFILFIAASHFGIYCQDWKLKHKEEKGRNISWMISHRRKIHKLTELPTILWAVSFLYSVIWLEVEYV